MHRGTGSRHHAPRHSQQRGPAIMNRLMRLFARERHVLLTRLTPAECQERLRPRPAADHSWLARALVGSLPAGGPVKGRVKADGFALRKFAWYASGFPTVATGHYVPTSNGTRI